MEDYSVTKDFKLLPSIEEVQENIDKIQGAIIDKIKTQLVSSLKNTTSLENSICVKGTFGISDKSIEHLQSWAKMQRYNLEIDNVLGISTITVTAIPKKHSIFKRFGRWCVDFFGQDCF